MDFTIAPHPPAVIRSSVCVCGLIKTNWICFSTIVVVWRISRCYFRWNLFCTTSPCRRRERMQLHFLMIWLCENNIFCSPSLSLSPNPIYKNCLSFDTLELLLCWYVDSSREYISYGTMSSIPCGTKHEGWTFYSSCEFRFRVADIKKSIYVPLIGVQAIVVLEI